MAKATTPKVAAPKAAKPKTVIAETIDMEAAIADRYLSSMAATKVKKPKKKSEKLPLPKDYVFLSDLKLDVTSVVNDLMQSKLTASEPFDGKDTKVNLDEFVTWQSPEIKSLSGAFLEMGIKTVERHLNESPEYYESVRHALDGLLFTEAKKRMVRRNKANISVGDLEEIVKDMMPKLVGVFKID